MEIEFIPNSSALFEKESIHSNSKEEYKDTVYFNHTIPLIQDILLGFSNKELEFIILEEEVTNNE
jgi:hypothetical protein